MQKIYETLYRPGLELQLVGIIIGVWLIASHLFGLLTYERCRDWLKKLPRYYPIGVGLMIFNFIWTFFVWTYMDLGEFYTLERPVQIIIVIGGAAVIYYVRDFLAVRAIGMFGILLAAPILVAAFLEPFHSRRLLVLLSYAIIVIGMFWVGKPYLMRDQIAWVTKTRGRWNIACALGFAYGIAVLACALMWWGQKPVVE